MKWKRESYFDRNQRLSKWHKYFAWYPVFVYAERKIIWFERTERRLVYYSSYTGSREWEYRTKGEER